MCYAGMWASQASRRSPRAMCDVRCAMCDVRRDEVSGGGEQWETASEEDNATAPIQRMKTAADTDVEASSKSGMETVGRQGRRWNKNVDAVACSTAKHSTVPLHCA